MMKCLWFRHLWIICFVKIILFILSLILWGEKWNDFLITWCFTIKHNLYSVLFLSKSSNFMPITTQALRTRIHFLSVFRSVKAPLGPQSRISWISETFFTFSRSWRRRASSRSTWRKTFEKNVFFRTLINFAPPQLSQSSAQTAESSLITANADCPEPGFSPNSETSPTAPLEGSFREFGTKPGAL